MGRIVNMAVNRLGCVGGYCSVYSARCSERLVSFEDIDEFKDFIMCLNFCLFLYPKAWI
jgi:hypothetical protein